MADKITGAVVAAVAVLAVIYVARMFEPTKKLVNAALGTTS